MNKRIIAAIVAVIAVLGIGIGIASTSSSSKSSETSATGHNAADIKFAQQMIPHHQQAVQMADLASTRASNADVKQLALQIKAAQDPEINLMKGWLGQWHQPTGDMSGMSMGSGSSEMASMPGMMSDADMTKLAAANGADFDKQFLTMMIGHHEGAITMAKDELANGQYGASKDLAGRIITSQQAEITRMDALIKTI
jgi:uncharacterized protein (DUF305 family)